MRERSKKGPDPLKICVVAACPFPHSRGSPIRIQRLANALADRGHEVDVYTYHLGKDAPEDRFDVIRCARVPTYRKMSPGPSIQKLLIVDPLLTAKLSAGIRRKSYDIIHAHHYEGLLAARLGRGRRGIPLVYDAHTLLGSELPYYKLGLPQQLISRLGNRVDRWLPGLSDHVVSVTQTIKDKLVAQGMADEKISVITNGVEYEMFPARADGEVSAAESRRLIFTGNLASYQGIDHLLHAFAKVVQKNPSLRLLLVAKSSFEPYEELARELHIRDKIEVSDAPFADHPRLLAESAVAVNPRVNADGIPQKLLNYMAASCATVSFEGSAPCIENGVTGLTVENGNTDAFADAVLRLLDNPALADRIGRQARDAVLTSFTWGIAAERCEDLYVSLLHNDRGGASVMQAGGVH
jgi:glycosyltransferase involved in cell wall biosynthesis